MPTSSEVIKGKWNLSVKLPKCIDSYNNRHPTAEYRIIEFTTPDCINLIYLAMEKEIMNVLENISRFKKRKESKESLSEYLQNRVKRRRTNDEFSLEDLLDCFMQNICWHLLSIEILPVPSRGAWLYYKQRIQIFDQSSYDFKHEVECTSEIMGC